MSRLDQIEFQAWAALRPPAKLRLSEWTETNVYLPATLAAAPGLMRLFPYQRDMADAMSDPAIERVSVLKSARVGYTQLTIAALAHFAANDPSAVLVVLPTESDARHMMTGIIEPTFRESPGLRDVLAADTTGRDTMLSRHFPGGNLALVSASSPRNLRARTARVLIMDELDGWEIDARGEGDPLALAEKRTFTFSDRKIIAGSTPVDEDTSRICRLYAQSDQRVWECPCPHCGDFHELKWADIRWDIDRPDTAAWACPSCGLTTQDCDKASMLLHGAWRVTKSEVTGHAGFKINALASLLANAAWPKLAAEFVEAKRSPVTLKPFVNTILGEPWRGEGEEIDEAALASRREPFSLANLPPEALVLTTGVDVQHDRLEAVTLAHGRDTTFVIDQRVFWGPVNESDAPWAELDDFLKSVIVHPKGGVIRIDATAVDSSDGATMDRVLAFCQPRMSRRVVAIKGATGNRPAIKASATRGQRLFIVGVDGIKTQLLQRLSRGTSIRFSDTLENRFFEELASERRVVRYTRGHPSAAWERVPGRQAESLDCVVYGLAVRNLVGVDLDVREADLAGRPKEARPAVARSKWLSG